MCVCVCELSFSSHGVQDDVFGVLNQRCRAYNFDAVPFPWYLSTLKADLSLFRMSNSTLLKKNVQAAKCSRFRTELGSPLPPPQKKKNETEPKLGVWLTTIVLEKLQALF